MTVMPQTSTLLQHHHDYLMCHRRGEVNEPLLAQMYASWMCHQGAMPLYLGLSLDVFRSMMAYHFPSLPNLPLPQAVTGLQAERLPELDDLRALLQQFHSQPPPDAGWMVEIVCAGCMGNNHLWQDLGLWSRRDLSQLMQTNFHDLAAQNTKDMKWKKFLYKQLCEAEGIYVCRAPSCEVCVDYAMCFNTPEVMP